MSFDWVVEQNSSVQILVIMASFCRNQVLL